MSINATQGNTTTTFFPFSDLPPELRNRIYEYTLSVRVGDSSSEVRLARQSKTYWKASGLAILQSCRQISDEAQGIYYNLSNLSLSCEHLPLFLDAISSDRLRTVASLALRVRTRSPLDRCLAHLKALPGLQALTLEMLDAFAHDGYYVVLCDGAVRSKLEMLAENTPDLRTITLRTLDDGPGNTVRKGTQDLLQQIVERVRAERAEGLKKE